MIKKMMKRISLKLLVLFFGITVMLSCKKEDVPPSSQDMARTNITRIWRLNVSSIRISNVALALVLPTLGGVFQLTDLDAIRLNIKSDGTYTVGGASASIIGFLGFNPSGTWAFDGTRADRIIFNPGALAINISNLSTTSMDISYTTSANPPVPISATLQATN
jgi:hypothetical protein